jgi:hypothetical protein
MGCAKRYLVSGMHGQPFSFPTSLDFYPDSRSTKFSPDVPCSNFRLVGGGNGLLCAMAQPVEQLPPLWAPYWASNEHLKDKVCSLLCFMVVTRSYFFPDVSAAKAHEKWMGRRPTFEHSVTV